MPSPTGPPVISTPIKNTIRVALSSTADHLRVTKSLILTVATLVAKEVVDNDTITKGGKHSEVPVNVDITAPDKIGISINVEFASEKAAVPGNHIEDEASRTLVRSEEYPLYSAVNVAATGVEK